MLALLVQGRTMGIQLFSISIQNGYHIIRRGCSFWKNRHSVQFITGFYDLFDAKALFIYLMNGGFAGSGGGFFLYVR